MFNTLASYLLGNSTVKSPTDTEPEDRSTTIDNCTSIVDDQNFKFNLITTNCEDDEEDWLLVEREGMLDLIELPPYRTHLILNISAGDSAPQTDSEEEIPFVEIKNNPIIRTRHSRNNSSAGSQDGAFSLLPSSPVPSSMDESWYVTPPPCFTSTGPVNVETSPLENLLIEHPRYLFYNDFIMILANIAMRMH